MLGLHGQRFDPHPNWCATQLIIVTHRVTEAKCTPANVVIAMHEYQELARGSGHHGLPGTECLPCVLATPPRSRQSHRPPRRRARGAGRVLRRGCASTPPVVADAGAELRRVRPSACRIPAAARPRPPARHAHDAAPLEQVPELARVCRQHAEPGQHISECMAIDREVVTDRVQIAEPTRCDDGRDRPWPPMGTLRPTDPKVVEPRIHHSSADLHRRVDVMSRR